MKKKWTFSNLFLLTLLMITLAYQSMHSIVHLIEEKHHQEQQDAAAHSHGLEHCYICDFAFSPFLTVNFFSLSLIVAAIAVIRFTYKSKIYHHPTKIYFSKRGPPSIFLQ